MVARFATKSMPMKRVFCQALMDLCEEMPLDKITASLVIQEAGTSRQTFYNHFHDINDLIAFLPINFLSRHSKEVFDTGGVKCAYRYAARHPAFFRQLPLHSGQNNFRESFILWLENAYYEEYIGEAMDESEKMRRMFAIDLYVSGVTDLFLEWCRADFSWNLDDLVQVQEEAAPPFVKTSAAAFCRG